MYFYIEPEVGGGLGENTVMNTTIHPPRVSKLHFQFDGWLGDDLLESFPCYIVSEFIAKQLELEGVSGFLLNDVEITRSEQFEDLYPTRVLPNFYWLIVKGVAGIDDIGLADDYRLVISEKTLNVLKKGRIKEADLEEYRK